MNTKDKIFACALELFTKKGFEKTTLNDIIKCCDISKGGLYHYFDSKEQIMDELIESLIKKQINEFKVVISEQNVSTFDKLILMIDYVFLKEQTEELNNNSLFYLRSIKMSKIKTIEFIEEILENAILDSSIKNCNLSITSIMIYAIIYEGFNIVDQNLREQYKIKCIEVVTQILK